MRDMKFLIDDKSKCGVYSIRNIINDKTYVGSTGGCFKKRYLNHRYQLKNKKHPNKHLQYAWNKYGPDKFEYSLLKLSSPETLIQDEQYFLDTNNSQYNIFKKAGAAGYNHSIQTKKKISNAFSGKNHPAHLGEYVFYHKNFGYAIDDMIGMSKRCHAYDASIGRLRRGNLNHHHGWICLGKYDENWKTPVNIEQIYANRTDRQPYYSFYHPKHGMQIHHISDFCRKYNLKRTNIKRIIESMPGSCSALGWICFGKVNKNYQQPDTFREIYDLTMRKNTKNKRMDTIKCKMVHEDGRIFLGTLKEFSKTYTLNFSCVRRLYNKMRKSYKNWKVCDENHE